MVRQNGSLGASASPTALAPLRGQAPSGLEQSRSSTGAALLALAERCEKATGPDRDLDREIQDILFPPLPPAPLDEQPPAGFGRGFLSGDYWGAAYTASLDDAMTLVPEGHARSLHFSPGFKAVATLWVPGVARQHQSVASTEAHALAAACLRARAASCDRSGEAGETALAGSTEGESAVAAAQPSTDAQNTAP